MFWFFRLRFRRAYDSAYGSDLWFSLGQKRSYASDSDSNYDSIASENQPLKFTTSIPVIFLMEVTPGSVTFLGESCLPFEGILLFCLS